MLVFFFVVALTGGCSKSGTIVKEKVYSSSVSADWQQEARLQHVPLPLNAQRADVCGPLESGEQPKDQIIVCYLVDMTIDQLIDFYTEQMERFGWLQIGDFRSHQTLLLFERPDKLCAIALTAVAKRVQLTIFFGTSLSARDRYDSCI